MVMYYVSNPLPLLCLSLLALLSALVYTPGNVIDLLICCHRALVCVLIAKHQPHPLWSTAHTCVDVTPRGSGGAMPPPPPLFMTGDTHFKHMPYKNIDLTSPESEIRNLKCKDKCPGIA